jgi:hypothetical protein
MRLTVKHAGFIVSETARFCLRLFSVEPNERQAEDKWFRASDPVAAAAKAVVMLDYLIKTQRWRDRERPSQARLLNEAGKILAEYRKTAPSGFSVVHPGEDDA